MEKEFYMDKKKLEYPEITSTAAATETTGLMQTPPENDDELEAYQQLAGMEIPKQEHEEK